METDPTRNPKETIVDTNGDTWEILPPHDFQVGDRFRNTATGEEKSRSEIVVDEPPADMGD